MRARSTCSNQRPDTLMQDRIARIDEISCTARPDHTFDPKQLVARCNSSYPRPAGRIIPYHPGDGALGRRKPCGKRGLEEIAACRSLPLEHFPGDEDPRKLPQHEVTVDFGE